MNQNGFNLSWETEVFILGADDRPSLVQRAHRMAKWCADPSSVILRDIAFSLNCQAGEHPFRLAVVASSVAQLKENLSQAAQRLEDPTCRRVSDRSGIYYTDEPLGRQGRLAFLFPGEGSQYPNMLADLCLHFPEVRTCFDLLDRALYGQGATLRPSQFIFPQTALKPTANVRNDQLWQMDGAVEAVFTANRALLALMDQLRLVPDVVLGHSTGEYNALLAAGAIHVASEEELIKHLRDGNHLSERLISEGRITQGALLAVGLADRQLIDSALETMRGRLWLAIDNCPHQVVLFGSESAIAETTDRLREAGAVCQRLPFDRAYHTPLFAAVAAELERFFSRINITPPRIEVYSCATAELYPTEPARIRQLVLDQWQSPVRFRETIETMYARGVRLFVEAGPRGNLTAFVADILRGKSHAAIPANVQHRSGITQLNHLVARLAAHGVPMQLEYLYSRRNANRISFDDGLIPKRSVFAPRLSLTLPFIGAPYGHINRAAPHDVTSLAANAANDKSLVGSSETPNGNASHANPPQDSWHSDAMQRYLQTMDQFLGLQQVVMGAFLSQQTIRQERPQVTAADGAQPRSATPSVSSNGPPSFASIVEAPPHNADAANSFGKLATIEETFLEILVDKTGYPREMLDLSANLEADLGIDSIKRVEILGAFQNKTGLLPDQAMESLTRLKTVRQIIEFIAQQLQLVLPKAQPEPEEIPESYSPVYRAEEELAPAKVQETFPGFELFSLTPGKEVRATISFDLSVDPLLRDHALGGKVSATDPRLCALVVVPLTMSLESLAQAASLLVPDKVLLAIREVRAHRWIALTDSQFTAEISARISSHSPLEINASLGERLEDGVADVPAVEARFVFGDPIEPKPVDPFDIANAGPSRWTGAQLYSEVMFHGPSFQGVVSIDDIGDDGLRATLRVPSEESLFRLPMRQKLSTTSLLLDAAGQLIGFWTAHSLPIGYVVFPFKVESIDLYGPPPAPGETFSAQARVDLVGEAQVKAAIDVSDSKCATRVRIRGWEDKRIEMEDDFFRFRISPDKEILSHAWPSVFAPLPAGHDLDCYGLELSERLLRAEGGIWRSVLAHLVLSHKERDMWKTISDRRRTQWLLGRVVAKDAARSVVHKQSGIDLYPADIEIFPDEYGQPHFSGEWMNENGRMTLLSIAHVDGLAAALIGDARKYKGVGIDIERTDRTRSGFDRIAFNDEERRAAIQGGANLDELWCLRLWCAKEAVAKALGRGLLRGPADLKVVDVQAATGTVLLEVSGALATALPDVAGQHIKSYTTHQNKFVTAIAWRN